MSTPNYNQQLAIESIDGPVLIIAGPGSGKTFTLIERICNLIVNQKVDPESLLVVTFTEKAASELKTRISNRLLELQVNFNVNEMYLGTFHSICLRILEENKEYTRLKQSYHVLDSFDLQYFIYREIGQFLNIDKNHLVIQEFNLWRQSEQLIRSLQKIIEEEINVDDLRYSQDPILEILAELYDLYTQLLLENNFLDFSGLQYEVIQLFDNAPHIEEKLKSQLSYLMVDEYQDTNTIQESILFRMLGKHQNLCVVGDDDQGIYRFRGATIRNILTFPEKFKDHTCKVVDLSVNYRSHKDIIAFYNRWMDDPIWFDNNRYYRFPKVIKPSDVASKSPINTSTVSLVTPSNETWSESVIKCIKKLKQNSNITDWNQIAFLFRSVKNKDVKELARNLEKTGIPVYSPRSNMFFERLEIKLFIGALIFLFPRIDNVKSEKSNYWPYLDGLSNIHKELDKYYKECLQLFTAELKKDKNKDLLRFCQEKSSYHIRLTKNTDYAFTGLFYQLLAFPLFSQFIDDDKNNIRSAHNLSEITKILTRFEYFHKVHVLTNKNVDNLLRILFNTYFRFLYESGVDEYEDAIEYAPKGSVSFLTIHQSKGLEFPVVICGSVDTVPMESRNDVELLLDEYIKTKNIEPSERMKDFDFKRLFYTAFSRAQNLLVLSSSKFTKAGKATSKYFEEYFNDLPSFYDCEDSVYQIDFETIKRSHIKKEYSFTSHISVYERCPEQYRLYKELEFSPVRMGSQLFGRLVHSTIEDIHKTVLRGEQGSISETQIEKWFETNYQFLVKTERQYLVDYVKNVALNHVQRYYSLEKNKLGDLLEAEIDLSLIKDEYILTGVIDLIKGDGNSVELIDFKSEKKPDIFKNIELVDQYKRQLEIYAHLIEEKTGKTVTRTHLYYTGEENGNPYISFDRDARDIDQTIKTFDSIVEKIEKRDYRLSERPTKLCGECDMQLYCDKKNWNFKKV